MRLDRIGSIAWGLSTAVHLGIIVLALWRLAAPPVPEEPPPEAEPPAEQTASQELQPVPEPAQASAGDLAEEAGELPPLDWRDLPGLTNDLPQPRDYHHLDEEHSRGTGTEALGAELDLASSSVDRAPGLLEAVQDQTRVADEEVDRWTQEWQRTAFQFALVNQIRETWQQRWQPAFGHRGPRTSIRIELSVSRDGSVSYHGILPDHGTGLPELDRRIDNYLRRRPATTVQPTRELAGRLPFVLKLD